jgi:hypothetical protein
VSANTQIVIINLEEALWVSLPCGDVSTARMPNCRPVCIISATRYAVHTIVLYVAVECARKFVLGILVFALYHLASLEFIASRERSCWIFDSRFSGSVKLLCGKPAAWGSYFCA